MSNQEDFFGHMNTIIVVGWFIIIVSFLSNIFGYGMDATDKSSLERSGLRLLIDHETGIHYLSDGKGGMMLRQGEYKQEQGE